MGGPELPNACQGPPKQHENIINSMVLARCSFSLKVILLVDPLAKLGPLLLQTGCKRQSCGQALTNLSTQSTAVDLHAQLHPRICPIWPSSWLHFLRFCDQIGWHGFGQAGGPSSRFGETVQMLLWRFRTGLVSWASLTESVRMLSTGKPKAEQGTDQG